MAHSVIYRESASRRGETAMRIAVLRTGMVGDTIASKLVKVGHRSMVGSRTADSDAGQAFLRRVGG
jgi:hypothetical protein